MEAIGNPHAPQVSSPGKDPRAPVEYKGGREQECSSPSLVSVPTRYPGLTVVKDAAINK